MASYAGPDQYFELPGRLRGACRDPNDDAILECAMVSNARFIVTGDEDLLRMKAYQGVVILRAREYLLGSTKAT